MNIFIIAVILLLALGVLCFAAPQLIVRADRRDDPDALAQIKKAGPLFIAFAIGAALLALKYTLT